MTPTRIRAKLFRDGGSQAVRLPKACSFPGGHDEVFVRKEGRAVILEPVDEWSDTFLACLGSLDEDIPLPKRVLISTSRARKRAV